jgi:hypothetical protein
MRTCFLASALARWLQFKEVARGVASAVARSDLAAL